MCPFRPMAQGHKTAPTGRALALRSVRSEHSRSFTPATLNKALVRPCLVYPLASLDVSGQWPVSIADASPNEGLYFSGWYHCDLLKSIRYCAWSRHMMAVCGYN